MDAVRDDFINTVYVECADDSTNDRANSIIDAFDTLPTVEADPVKHGHWVYGEFGTPHCSECGKEIKPNDVSPFCPNCGAKMDGGIPDATIHDKK